MTPENFMISESSSLILPFHQEMDEIREDAAGISKIGTTRRGIGPCYEDKVGRRAIRVMDLRSESNLNDRLENVLQHHNAKSIFSIKTQLDIQHSTNSLNKLATT